MVPDMLGPPQEKTYNFEVSQVVIVDILCGRTG